MVEHDRARRLLREALCKAIKIKAFLPLVNALPAVSLVLADEGRSERAVEIYALASRYGFVANSCWFEDLAGKHIAAVAATLPPEVVAAAQERGRARDLWATAEELAGELEDKLREMAQEIKCGFYSQLLAERRDAGAFIETITASAH
jgi:hypothetical protein